LQIEQKYEAVKFSAAAEIINCHCARVRDLLQNSATGKPRCCSNGNYRPWQCVGTKCFCVDKMGRQDMRYNEAEDPSELDCYPDDPDPNDGEEPECEYEQMIADGY